MRKINKIILSLLATLLLATGALAGSTVYCIGGGASNVDATHRFGLFGFYGHSYKYSYHDVSNQSSGVIYYENGHDSVINCGQHDFSFSCPVGSIVQSSGEVTE